MFGGAVRFPVVVSIDYDPGADDILPVWRAPQACEIKSAYAIAVSDVAAGTVNYFAATLQNGGTAGTATDAISAAIGGTPGWTGLLPVAFAIGSGSANLAAGEVVTVSYDETGTGTFTQLIVQLDVVMGT